jgi:hypothetical protein
MCCISYLYSLDLVRMSVSTTGLKAKNSTSTLSTQPSIDTTITVSINDASNNCIDILASAKRNQNSLNTFLSTYKLQESTTTAINLIDNLTEFKTELSQADTTQTFPEGDIKNYITQTVPGSIQKIRLASNCLYEETVMRNTDELDKQKEITEESKLRYESILHPEQKVSYYEGWFPLFRPMKESAIFVLFAIGLLFLLFSITVFLRMSGFDLKVEMPTIMLNTGGGDSNYRPFIIGGALVGGVFGLIGYSRGWFSK